MIHENTLVILSCDMDRWHLESCCRSIHKYLQEPCNILFGYVDSSYQFHSWRKWFDEVCMPFLDQHTVSFYHNQYTYDHNFTHVAYCTKLLIAREVKTKTYWMIDSKHFFFKPATFASLKEEFPKRRLPDTQPYTVYQNLCDFFETPVPRDTLFKWNTMPFRFETALCVEMLESIHNFYERYMKCNIKAADCHTYEWYTIMHDVRTPGEVEQNNSCMFLPANDFSARQVASVIKSTNPNVVISGMHRDVCTYLGQADTIKLIAWCGGKDLIPQNTAWSFSL